MSEELNSPENSNSEGTPPEGEAKSEGMLEGEKSGDDKGDDKEGKGLLEGDKEGDNKDDKTDNKETPKEITYQDFKLPDDTEIDQEKLNNFTELAKKHHLTQEAAQELIDHYVSQLKQQSDEQMKAIADVRKEWRKTINEDPEIGGNNIQKSLGLAISALDKFPGGNEVKDLLVETGLQDNPAVIRFLYSVGKATSEDSIDDFKGGKAGEQKSLEEILYPGYG